MPLLSVFNFIVLEFSIPFFNVRSYRFAAQNIDLGFCNLYRTQFGRQIQVLEESNLEAVGEGQGPGLVIECIVN